jgi:hypothetical protein
VPCAAFTEEQVRILRLAALRAREAGGAAGGLDALRAGSIECLRSSWPRAS